MIIILHYISEGNIDPFTPHLSDGIKHTLSSTRLLCIIIGIIESGESLKMAHCWLMPRSHTPLIVIVGLQLSLNNANDVYLQYFRKYIIHVHVSHVQLVAFSQLVTQVSLKVNSAFVGDCFQRRM